MIFAVGQDQNTLITWFSSTTVHITRKGEKPFGMFG
jgi:hypothetical protein